MGKKKQKKIDLNNLKPEEEMKYEIARELGYLDKVMSTGWNSLTAKESGRIGGIITKRKREMKRQMEEKNKEDRAN
ncbi:MAG: small, acid-soluble spore protein, alpha/beta type [Clostridiales bacterium]|nr:small, acid-soluble spore protein, alpha/beta type [Clostridiales bacterium]